MVTDHPMNEQNYEKKCRELGQRRMDFLREEIATYDGFVFMGNDGADIPPKGEPHPETVDERKIPTLRKRGVYENAMMMAVLKSAKPMLCICGAMQRLNNICGGELDQHLPDRLGHNGHQQEKIGKPANEPSHEITLCEDTRIALAHHMMKGGERIESAPASKYNIISRHHQGVYRVGNGLKTTAYAEETDVTGKRVKIPEALETRRSGDYKGWVVAVQGHPELEEGKNTLGHALAKELVYQVNLFKEQQPQAEHGNGNGKRVRKPTPVGASR